MMLPLDGMRVLDLTTLVFGPVATQTLGDMGADVIKIEAPDGDATRILGPMRSPKMAAMFLTLNRNKRSLVLDLKTPEGKQILWQLIADADAFVHNMRPQKMAALGFDEAAVRQHNPRLVYAGLYGFGAAGIYAGEPAYDDVIQGLSGIVGAAMARDGKASFVPMTMADKLMGVIAAQGILAALIKALRSGQGCCLETAMFEGMTAFTMADHQYRRVFRPADGGAGYERVTSPHRPPLPTADGYICALPYTDAQFQRFWLAAERADLAADQRFTSYRDRQENIDALYALMAEVSVTKTTAEWLQSLKAQEIPCGPVNSLDEVFDDPHLKSVGFFRDVMHPSEGALTLPDTAFQFDGASLPIREMPPTLGQHGSEILAGIGYTAADIERFIDQGVTIAPSMPAAVEA